MSRFYGPMALYYVLMLVSHIFVGIGFSRSENPTVTFAAYGLAFAVTGFFSAVVYSVRSLVLVMGPDRALFAVVTRLAVVVIIVMTVGQTLVSFTPLGKWIFGSILHASGDLLEQSLLGSTVMPLMVVADGLRGLMHGRLVVQRRPAAMLVGMLLRNAALVGWLLLAHSLQWQMGALLGTAGMTFVIGVEALVALVAVIMEPVSAPKAAPAEAPGLGHTFRLFLPLAGTSVIAAILPLLVSATIARVTDPELNLAAYQVASAVGGLLHAFMHPVSDLVVVSVRTGATTAQSIRFGLFIGGAIGALLLILGLAPIGQPILRALYKTPDPLALAALQVIQAKALFAVVETGRLCLFGMAVLRANTRAIFFAKGLGIAVAGIAAFTLPRTGAVIGIWLLVIASAAEIVTFLVSLNERGLQGWLPAAWKSRS